MSFSVSAMTTGLYCCRPPSSCTWGGGGLRTKAAYLFGQPADVFEVGVRGGGRRPQVGVDVSQRVRQQGGDVGVHGGEPAAGRGAVLTAQNHRVLAVRGVELQQPAAHGDYVSRWSVLRGTTSAGGASSQRDYVSRWSVLTEGLRQQVERPQRETTPTGGASSERDYTNRWSVLTEGLHQQVERPHRGTTSAGGASSQRDYVSRSGMVRFLLMKHIFRLMTFLSLEEGEEPQCLGEPESSLPLSGRAGRPFTGRRRPIDEDLKPAAGHGALRRSGVLRFSGDVRRSQFNVRHRSAAPDVHQCSAATGYFAFSQTDRFLVTFTEPASSSAGKEEMEQFTSCSPPGTNSFTMMEFLSEEKSVTTA
ncbi:hypothetical protein EYF80_060651 [Liparis tanakae]|uniref:Uncharacterized protein n=1 Tax=Liparis tanakae TaxID=230148 RepID=A0A4Z2ELG5_9TELE|nr:hypothetical protein EYF80_060651 [Liparis tanakae]